MTEKQIDRLLVKAVSETLGGWAIKFEPIHLAGFPDRICLLPGGLIFFAEVKAPGKRPRPIQITIINKLIRLGFDVYVVDSPEQIETILKKYKK